MLDGTTFHFIPFACLWNSTRDALGWWTLGWVGPKGGHLPLLLGK